MPVAPPVHVRKITSGSTDLPVFKYRQVSCVEYDSFHCYSDRILRGEHELILTVTITNPEMLIKLIWQTPKHLYWNIFNKYYLSLFKNGELPSTSALTFLKLMFTGVVSDQTKSYFAKKMRPFLGNKKTLLTIVDYFPQFVLEFVSPFPSSQRYAWLTAVNQDARLFFQKPRQPMPTNLRKLLWKEIEESDSIGSATLYYQLSIENRLVLDETLLCLRVLPTVIKQLVVGFAGLVYQKRPKPSRFVFAKDMFYLTQTDYMSVPSVKKAKTRKRKIVISLV